MSAFEPKPVRQGTLQIDARRRARERGARFREREAQLEMLAADFIVSAKKIGQIETRQVKTEATLQEAHDANIRSLRDRMSVEIACIASAREDAVRSMRDLGVTADDIAERVGEPARVIRGILKHAPSSRTVDAPENRDL